jgi:nitroimidazol reductase NimA-like FMN-containing flavoprotein (pyridoxamine 5'-phosphate oxidase superfamily)
MINFFRKLNVITIIITGMSKKEVKKFLMRSTFTAKLATVRKGGSPHIVPIWFVLDNQKGRTREGVRGDIILTTYGNSLKARNIQQDGRVSICIDDQTPQFSFVTIYVSQKYTVTIKSNYSSGLLK